VNVKMVPTYACVHAKLLVGFLPAVFVLLFSVVFGFAEPGVVEESIWQTVLYNASLNL